MQAGMERHRDIVVVTRDHDLDRRRRLSAWLEEQADGNGYALQRLPAAEPFEITVLRPRANR
jgi:hypothetical protein